ncbi:MAG: hypothetical protein KGL37_11350, partial [Acidobacteriota bacterium]|nr:hypothetical protein [Acidobacteriota bacterium]
GSVFLRKTLRNGCGSALHQLENRYSITSQDGAISPDATVFVFLPTGVANESSQMFRRPA